MQHIHRLRYFELWVLRWSQLGAAWAVGSTHGFARAFNFTFGFVGTKTFNANN